MRFLFTILFALTAVTTTSFAQAPDWLWVKSHSAITGVPTVVATSKSGDVYVAGNFFDSLLLDNTLWINPRRATIDYSAYVIKYDAGGKIVWAKIVGPNLLTPSLVLDSEENIYVLGHYATTYNGPDSVGHFSLTGDGCYVAKYSPQGDLTAVATSPADVGSPNSAFAADAYGNIYVATDFYDSILVDTTKLYSKGKKDIMLAKFDKNLKAQWAKNIGSKNDEEIGQLVPDKSGNLYLSCGTMIMDSFVHDSIRFYGVANKLVMKLDSGGKAQWGKAYWLNDINMATDDSDNLFITSEGWGQIDSFILKAGSGKRHLFALKYDGDGNRSWGKIIAESEDYDVGWDAICTDKYGSLYMAGYFRTSISFNSSLLSSAKSGSHKFLIKVNSEGETSWWKAIITNRAMTFKVPGLSTDLLGNVYVCGYFSDTCHFDNYTLIERRNGDINPFLAKLASSTFIDDIQKSEDNILVYPNPTTGNLTITVDSDGYDNVAVYDAIGRRVYHQPVSKQQNTTKLELGHLANGVYNLRLSGKDKQLNRQISVLK